MLEIIRYTILSVFDLYARRGKQLFAVSFKVAVLVSVYSAVVAGALMLFAGSLYHKGMQHTGLESLLLDTNLNLHWSSLIGYLSIITFALFGLHIKRQEQETGPISGNVMDCLQGIDKKTYAELTVAFGIAYVFFYWAEIWFYSPAPESYSGALDYLGGGPEKNIGRDFREWAWGFCCMLGSYIPAVLGALIIARNFTNLKYTELLKVYYKGIIAVVLMMFVAIAIEVQARVWLEKYVVQLLTLPFGNSITLSAFTVFVVVTVGAFFVPALAGTMLYPVQYIYNMLSEEQKTLYALANEDVVEESAQIESENEVKQNGAGENFAAGSEVDNV